jgi:mono/diheme cytochrome c family protein
LPAEKPVVLPRGAGVELVEAHCSACHSLDYVTTQPRGKGERFWADSVEKMIDTHGAEIPEGDRKVIVAYLGRTFG